MSFAFLILPLSLAAIWFLISTYSRITDQRLTFLLTLIGSNLYLVFIVEILSLFDSLTKTPLFVFWTFPIGLLIFLQVLPSTHKRLVLPRLTLRDWSWIDKVLLLLVASIIVIAGVTAFFAPPNTPDVLNYHLPRVCHWIQNQSVRHYPSGIEIQNNYPPGSEYQVLQLMLLSGDDQLVNFPSWIMLIGSVFCGSTLAALLGANRTGQLFSALFIATLPNAIMQSSSVKNDLHVAFWVLACLTLMVVYYFQNSRVMILLAIFASIGLGFLTKTNTIIYLAPILIWFAALFVHRKGFLSALQWGIAAVLIFTLVNAGFLSRNFLTFGTVLDTYQAARLRVENVTPGSIFSNLLRNTGFQLQWPWPEIRGAIELFIIKVHAKLGLDINDPQTTSEGYFQIMDVNTNENFSGNPLHALTILFFFIIYVVSLIKQKASLKYWLPVLFSISGFIFFSTLIKWQVFGARYFLPVFFLAAPVGGVLLSKKLSPVFLALLAVVLLFCSWPWLLSIENRPLISKNNYAGYPSILTSDRMMLLLGGDQSSYPGLYQLPEFVINTRCQSIGIYGGGATTEYQIWAMLDAPRDNLRLEWIVAGTPSAEYMDPNFDPCIIVCHQCPPDQIEIKGLEKQVAGNIYSLYVNIKESGQ